MGASLVSDDAGMATPRESCSRSWDGGHTEQQQADRLCADVHKAVTAELWRSTGTHECRDCWRLHGCAAGQCPA